MIEQADTSVGLMTKTGSCCPVEAAIFAGWIDDEKVNDVPYGRFIKWLYQYNR